MMQTGNGSGPSGLLNGMKRADNKIRFEDWGFEIERLFEVAYRFYKRNESKAFHPTFDERNHLNALILQARYGNFDDGKAPEIGVLDLIGKRRRYEWSLLKGISKKEAMSEFICLLDDICPLFKAHAEAVKISTENNDSRSNPIEQTTVNQISPRYKTEEGNHSSNKESMEQLQTIHSSLCRQTFSQFKSYAEKQYPNDPSQQNDLIKNLQEQYYQQYISKMHPELSEVQRKPSTSVSSRSPANSETSNSDKNSINTYINVRGDTTNANLHNEENNLQADISSEEINHEDLMAYQKNDGIQDIGRQQPTQPCPSVKEGDISDVQLRTGSIDQVDHNNDEQESHIEPVRLYQNIEPPIGPFEPFPEPIPIKNQPNQSIPTEFINPNLPTYQQNPAASKHEGLQQHQEESNQTTVWNNHHAEPPPKCINESTKESPDQVLESGEDSSHQSPVEQQQQSDDVWNYSPPPRNIPQEPIEEATTWSKRGVNEFKDSLEDDKQGGVYEVKQGTQVYIQVPTYPDGRYIYFEFATDEYDIGFGLDFVYESNLIEPLALNIYEESDDEDDDFENDNWQDLELGNQNPELLATSPSAVLKAEKLRRLSNTLHIIPTYRRDSHEEIFVCRHKYPGRGYYLLKFDNTYSVLRSKTLYFRICYFV